MCEVYSLGTHSPSSFESVFAETLSVPVWGRGVYFLANRETFLDLRSELSLNALPVTTIDFFRTRTIIVQILPNQIFGFSQAVV